ncbi:igLON family member 5 [Brachionus plicatilis]|uniref:IgLON family member 5 n=1 Tax=Brachionus plicatilis TaxID=10195 RepID=A0A3M7P8Y6_BRAPC|nr:igLON family member 5 [Brachionus plicatilis]
MSNTLLNAWFISTSFIIKKNKNCTFNGKITYVELSQLLPIDYNEPKIVTKQTRLVSFEYHTVILPCVVENLPQEMPVIWQYGKRDENNQTVLTVGATQLENNYRMRLMTNLSANDQSQMGKRIVYNLEIRKVSCQDSGWYECQLPTKPTQINYVHLEVLTMPKIEVSGKIARLGEPFELTCKVKNLPQRYQLTWYLNGQKIPRKKHEEKKTSRNGRDHLTSWFNDGFLLFKKKTDLAQSLSIVEETFRNLTISRLRIDQIDELHIGVFKCRYDRVEANYYLDAKMNSKARIYALDLLSACGSNLAKNSVLISDH